MEVLFRSCVTQHDAKMRTFSLEHIDVFSLFPCGPRFAMKLLMNMFCHFMMF